MISIGTAHALKEAGLEWRPAKHDFFAIPYQDLDEHYFVISDMSVLIEFIGDTQAITFNGTAEWALDYLVVTEAVWVPTEAQLRRLLEEQLIGHGEAHPIMGLVTTSDGYCCTVRYRGSEHAFEAFSAEEAYAQALLMLIRNPR